MRDFICPYCGMVGGSPKKEVTKVRCSNCDSVVALPVSMHRAVSVTDINMPFWSMVNFMIKWVIATIPAATILAFFLFLLFSIFGVVFAHAGSIHDVKAAVEAGDIQTLEQLLDDGFGIHFGADYMLRRAAKLGNLKMVKFLVKRGANIHRLKALTI